MSISVHDWYKQVQSKEVELVAGAKGVNNSIERLHFVEKADLASFLKGNELIFITGVALSDENELTEIIKRCYASGISACVVNIGTFIRQVPMSATTYCNTHNLPLFTVPWHVHLEELMQDTYQMTSSAINNEKTHLEELFENALRFPDMHRTYVNGLKENGFLTEWKYCTSIIQFPTDVQGIFAQTPKEEILSMVKQELSHEAIPCSALFYQQMIVMIFANEPTESVEKITEAICKMLENRLKLTSKILFSVGRNTKSVRCISKSYALAEQIINMHQNKQLPETMHSYDSLGVYKVVMGLGKSEVLNEIRETYLTPLETYDRTCGTDYCHFIQCFLHYDGKIKEIADNMYVHRNTVHYKIHKVEDILGCDIQRADIKMYLLIAFMTSQIEGNVF